MSVEVTRGDKSPALSTFTKEGLSLLRRFCPSMFEIAELMEGDDDGDGNGDDSGEDDGG